MQPRTASARFRATLLVAVVVLPGIATSCAPPVAGEPSGGGVATVSPSPAVASPSLRPTPTPAPTFATYRVRRGDTLDQLAKRFGTTPESLAYWNRARYPSLDPESPAYRPDRIEVGWRLLYLRDSVVDPENLPPASAGPAASGAAVGPYPSLPPDGSAALVTRGPPGLDGVVLTFDYAGGPGAGEAGPAAVLAWLIANGVPATVFLAAAAADPADPAAAAVLARVEGSGGRVGAGILAPTDDPAKLADALATADATLAAALGRTTAPLVRPARGTASPAALQAAGGAGWTWAISWDVDPGDDTPPGSGGPIAADIVARVVSRAEGGSIVRLQLGGARTLEALPGLVDGLASVGLRVLPLNEVLGLAGD